MGEFDRPEHETKFSDPLKVPETLPEPTLGDEATDIAIDLVHQHGKVDAEGLWKSANFIDHREQNDGEGFKFRVVVPTEANKVTDVRATFTGHDSIDRFRPSVSVRKDGTFERFLPEEDQLEVLSPDEVRTYVERLKHRQPNLVPDLKEEGPSKSGHAQQEVHHSEPIREAESLVVPETVPEPTPMDQAVDAAREIVDHAGRVDNDGQYKKVAIEGLFTDDLDAVVTVEVPTEEHFEHARWRARFQITNPNEPDEDHDVRLTKQGQFVAHEYHPANTTVMGAEGINNFVKFAKDVRDSLINGPE